MYVRPSTSVIVAPFADLMNRGVPPTPRNARTGELTPPGISSTAFENSSSDRMRASIASVSLLITRRRCGDAARQRRDRGSVRTCRKVDALGLGSGDAGKGFFGFDRDG